MVVHTLPNMATQVLSRPMHHLGERLDQVAHIHLNTKAILLGTMVNTAAECLMTITKVALCATIPKTAVTELPHHQGQVITSGTTGGGLQLAFNLHPNLLPLIIHT